ncbi:hypothetical protein AcW1_002002 [Taiwanofungus camphoratus]|nr:hypothetical protein AcW1_002002 [Antrodia cinnamomea]
MPGRKRNLSLRTTDTWRPASAENSSAPRPAAPAGRREENWKIGGAGRAVVASFPFNRLPACQTRHAPPLYTPAQGAALSQNALWAVRHTSIIL